MFNISAETDDGAPMASQPGAPVEQKLGSPWSKNPTHHHLLQVPFCSRSDARQNYFNRFAKKERNCSLFFFKHFFIFFVFLIKSLVGLPPPTPIPIPATSPKLSWLASVHDCHSFKAYSEQVQGGEGRGFNSRQWQCLKALVSFGTFKQVFLIRQT